MDPRCNIPYDFEVVIPHIPEACKCRGPKTQGGTCECEPCDCGTYFMWVESDNSFLYAVKHEIFFDHELGEMYFDSKGILRFKHSGGTGIIPNGDQFTVALEEAYKIWWASRILGVSETNTQGG